MKQDRKFRDKPTCLWLCTLTKKEKIYGGEEIVSSINGAEKTGKLHVKNK